MGESATMAPNVAFDVIRLLFASIDRPAYFLLGLMYRLFFNVASADIFANDTIMKFYSRVQLILGVFMMFQLAVIILRGIMNPDSFVDSKSGISNLITRISIGLFLLVSLVPINIPSPKNEYEKQLNNNGLLFGTLYSLQNRLLTNNTLGRLILGTTDTTDYDYMSTNKTANQRLKTASNIFTTTILKGFYRINLLPEAELDNIPECSNAADPATINQCRMCQSGIDDYIDVYKELDASPGDIISMVNETCEYDSNIFHYIPIKAFKYLTGNTRYIFTYSPVISTIVAIVFIVILFSFTIDVAVRTIKLGILRLLAPIPIITYMDPKGSKDSAFNAWVKILTATYLDLFMRLAIVYFVIFLIQQMIVKGIVVNYGHGILGLFTFIILWIGLFIFAKQAPKFIRQVLGLKDESFKLFGGLKEVMALGSVAKGFVSGGISGAVANYNPADPYGGLKAGLGGVKGFFGGGMNAAKKYYTDDKADYKTINNANRLYTQKTYSNAADGSTFKGRFMSGLQSDLGLKTDYQKMEDKIKYYGAAENAVGRINKAFDGNGDAKVTFNGNTIRDANNNVLLQQGQDYSLKDYNDILNRVNASGDATLIAKVDKAKKDAQGARFDQIRRLSREQIETNIANGVSGWSTNDLVVYDSAKTIYDVAGKYSSEPEFKRFVDPTTGSVYSFDHDYIDPNTGNPISGWGFAYKHDAGQAGKTADQIKNSDAYAQAKANDERAEAANKK